MIARVLMAFALLVGTAFAQAGEPVPYKDISMLQPPKGSKVAVVVFEDLGCPGCAKWHPYEQAAADKEHVPLVRYDFPIAGHIWTFQGAVNARYLQDTLHNPALATQYRTDVFRSQMQIASKDDLQQYTARWLQQHGQQVPFVIDPQGTLAKKVQADFDLGRKMNLQATPTVIVVTHEHFQVLSGLGKVVGDPESLVPAIEAAKAQTAGPAMRARSAKR